MLPQLEGGPGPEDMEVEEDQAHPQIVGELELGQEQHQEEQEGEQLREQQLEVGPEDLTLPLSPMSPMSQARLEDVDNMMDTMMIQPELQADFDALWEEAMTEQQSEQKLTLCVHRLMVQQTLML